MLNGLVDYIFGSKHTPSGDQNNVVNDDDEPSVCMKDNKALGDQVTSITINDGSQPNKEKELMDETYEEEWILVDDRSDINSSRSSPVLVRQPMAEVMEASEMVNFLEPSDTSGPRSRNRIQPVTESDNRALVTRIMFDGVGPNCPTQKQQQAESKAKTVDLSQGKIKRVNQAMEMHSQPKSKPRKARMKNHSGRNIDRKCQ